LDEIKRVGQRGNYITEQSTLSNLRSDEFWKSRVSILDQYDHCEDSGLTDVLLAAHKRVEILLQDFPPMILSPHILREIDQLISAFEERDLKV